MCDLVGQKRWDSITNLVILLCTVTLEKIVIGESLKPSRFSNGQASALQRVRVYEVMTIFCNMACYRRARRFIPLNTESIRKLS